MDGRAVVVVILMVNLGFVLHADKRGFERYVIVFNYIELVDVFDLTFILLMTVLPCEIIPAHHVGVPHCTVILPQVTHAPLLTPIWILIKPVFELWVFF